MRDDEPRPVWMSLLITHIAPAFFFSALFVMEAAPGRSVFGNLIYQK